MVQLRRKTCTQCGKLQPLSKYMDTTNRSHNHKTCSDCRSVRPWWVATARDRAIIEAYSETYGTSHLRAKQAKKVYHSSMPDKAALEFCLDLAVAPMTVPLAMMPKYLKYMEIVNKDPWVYPYLITLDGNTFNVVIGDRVYGNGNGRGLND